MIVCIGRKNIVIIGDSSGIMGFVLSFNPLSLGLEKMLYYGKFDIQFFTVQYHSMAIFPQKHIYISSLGYVADVLQCIRNVCEHQVEQLFYYFLQKEKITLT